MKLNTVIHGDCLSTLTELYSIAGEFADLIIFSPPYALQRKDTYEGFQRKTTQTGCCLWCVLA